MSTQKDSSLQSTKQMLDELDALMERMLTLPVNDVETAPPFPKEVVKAPALSATLTLLDPPQASSMPLEHPPLNPPHMAFSVATTELPPLPAEPAPLTNEVEPPSVMPSFEPLLAQIPEPDSEGLASRGYGPMLWINQTFDAVTNNSLAGQGGRTLLGLSGVAMMAIAVGWFLKDWLGWNW